jgi:hypothetical protein
VDVKRAGLAGFAALALAACGAQPLASGDVVAVYFASLGRDPMRSLPITTEAFHRAHGLALVTTSEARAWRGGAQLAAKPSGPDGIAAPEPVDRAQVAWLAIQDRDEFARVASELVATPTDVQEAGDVATVTVTVAPARAEPFLQTFRLTREAPGSCWRIDAIAQSGVGPGNEVAAFVAHPTEPARRAIAERMRPALQPGTEAH